jgi:integrase
VIQVKGSTFKRCGCRDEAGRQLGKACPKLGSRKHGSWFYVLELPQINGKRQQLRRGGFRVQREAEAALANEIARLCSGSAPGLADRRLTVSAHLDMWLAGKVKLRPSTRTSYEQHIRDYLKPGLGHLVLVELRADHIMAMMAMIRTGQLRSKRRRRGMDEITTATARRVFSTLRSALNGAVKQRLIPYNPCLGVELEEERREPAQVWTPDIVAAFLAHAESVEDRLAVLYRLVLLRGLRRGEVVPLRWSAVDLDECLLWVRENAPQIGGKVVLGRPKTKAGVRPVSLDAGTVEALRRHRKRQLAERLAWGKAYEDNDLVFARDDGSMEMPERVSRQFKQLARQAGLPPIKLHGGRHTAASLALEAGVAMKVVSDQLGHSTTAITSDLYTHVSKVVRDDAADRVAALLDQPSTVKQLRDDAGVP